MNRLALAAVALSVFAAGAAGAFVGARLADAATRPADQHFVIRSPDLAAGPVPGALRSAGGFTGFGGAPALTGEVMRAGEIASVDPRQQQLVIGAPGSEVTIRYASTARLFRLRPLTGALAPGDVVIVRFQGDAPVGVLRVPADLEQGVGSQASPRQRGLKGDAGGGAP
ncbi:MAG: hypothetical protein FJZ92_03530 [Chloroflexi bacterium]|nr:hypothetical protein [Chloroflexota bacterium]